MISCACKSFTTEIRQNTKKLNLKKSREQNIIDGCKKGKPEFQKELVLRYSGLLLTICRRYSQDTDSAKDVLQEALIKILKSIPNYQERGSFEAWMKRITINTALKYFDKSSFKNEVYVLEDLNDENVVPDIYSKLGAEELMALIDNLPNGFREVFNLFAIEGFSHKEIGTMLGITESTSRSQLTRARSLLKKQLSIREKIRIRI
jgi:RNA polymerase sigma-70 factor (ECF subfamily)